MRIIHIVTKNRRKMRRSIHGMHMFRLRISIFNKESIGAAFGRAPQGRGAPLWMLSLLNLIILCLEMCILHIIMRILCLFGNISRIISIIPIGPIYPMCCLIMSTTCIAYMLSYPPPCPLGTSGVSLRPCRSAICHSGMFF